VQRHGRRAVPQRRPVQRHGPVQGAVRLRRAGFDPTPGGER
jgi:hypothetical protein